MGSILLHLGEPSDACEPDFQPDISTTAHFLQARTAQDGGEEVMLLGFEMLDSEPSPTTVGLKCSLADVRKLVHTCLKALDSFGDRPASVLLKMLNQSRQRTGF